MYIRELEIDKFKSFASKVNIPFLKGFTTVAGINGSGKSNIIDAILFSLGFATANEMREKKLSEFISLYTNRNEASVSVTFATENPEEPELKIQRKIKKSSQGYNSIYYLNDKATTLSEIHLKLDSYNVNPNSYNVIMQNDVYRVVNCTPGQRRKMLEEIAGTADFDRRIAKATEELDTVAERVKNSNIILEEVSANLEKLEQEREQALKYKKLKDEKTGYESQITTVKYFDTQKTLDLVHQNILDSNKLLKEEKVKLEDVEKNITKTQDKFDNVEALVKSKGEAEQLKVKSEVESIKGDISRKENANNFAQKNIQQNLQKIENNENGIATAENKIASNKEQIEVKKAEIKTVDEKITLKKEELTKVSLEFSGLSQTANEFITRRNELNSQLSSAKDEELNIEKQKAPKEAELKSLNQEKVQIEEDLQRFQKTCEDCESKKETLNAQIELLDKDITDFRSAQERTMNELDTVKNEITDLEYDMRTSAQTIAKLEGEKLAFEEASFGREIDTIMRAKLKGVHAPLVQLGIVDKEYSRALEVAMGGHMRNVVVDDDYVAQQAIEILISQNAGRLTFLPLNKIKQAPNSLKLPKEKGVIDFAINLIDCENIYFDAFYYALGDTIIVEDYETAQKIAGKYRIVTLRGDLFDKSGSITGGSMKKSGLRFSSGQDDEIEKFKGRLKELEKKHIDLLNKKNKLEDKHEEIRDSFSKTMTEHSKAKIELNGLNENYNQAKQSIEEKQKRQGEVEPLIEKIGKDLDKLELKSAEVNESILKLQEEIAEIENKMSEEELEKLKASTANLEQEIKDLEKDKLKVEAEISDIERDSKFQEQTVIKTNHQNIDTFKKDNEKLAEEIKVREQEIADLKTKIEAKNEEIAKLGDVLKDLQNERDEINRELVDLSKQKGTYENNIERYEEQVESAKTRRKELEPVLEEARNQLIEAGVDISKLVPTNISVDELTAKINRLEKRMQELEPVNMRAITAYDEILVRKNEIDERINVLTKERQEIISRMTGYEELKKKTFIETYDNINKHFQEIYSELSDGIGSLILENNESPFEGGLLLEAQPKGKKKTRIESLSGGEGALVALSFVFAIQKNSPAPFYAFDEVDASLDPVNVQKLSEMIKLQAKNTQFIVVSHKKHMIESGNRTIGVTQKEKGKSTVTGIKVRD